MDEGPKGKRQKEIKKGGRKLEVESERKRERESDKERREREDEKGGWLEKDKESSMNPPAPSPTTMMHTYPRENKRVLMYARVWGKVRPSYALI